MTAFRHFGRKSRWKSLEVILFLGQLMQIYQGAKRVYMGGALFLMACRAMCLALNRRE
jgi:hypothetical protein